MKTFASKSKFTNSYKHAPLIHEPQLARNCEEIRQRAESIYHARGGMAGMTLNDWLKAELELKRELAETITKTENKIMKTTNSDLTVDICAEDGSRTRFYQNEEERVDKTLRQLVTPRLFSQPLLTLASKHSVSAIPTRTVDMILVHTESPPPLPLPPGWADVSETGGEAFLDMTEPEEPQLAQEGTLLAEVHTVGDWMVRLRLKTALPATIQESRVLWNHFLEIPVIPFHLQLGGIGLINPAKIVRVTVCPGMPGVSESALPVDLLESVRA